MNALQHLFIKSLLVISACACLNSLSVASSKLESSSPFLPPGYSKLKPNTKKPVQQSNSPIVRDLEFRGVVKIDGTYEISLFKKSENRGYWITENNSENGIRVSDFDVNNMSVTVTINGRSEQISLVAASANPLPVVATSPATYSRKPPSTQSLPKTQQAQDNTGNNTPRRRTIPRRRVILPTKKTQ